MNKKKIIVSSVIGLAVVATAALAGVGTSSAYRGDYSKQGPNYSQERHETMEKAFEQNDYNAWKEQMNGRGRVTQVVNEGNFARFAEAHKLAEQGKDAEADQIRTELGLRTKNGERTGSGYGQGQVNGKGGGMNRGQNNGGNFVDGNGDGTCDNLQ